jgi:23S rRNA (guanosine2251-2'-O)-methyltransferase
MNPNSKHRLVVGLQPVREAIRVHKSNLAQVLVDARPSPRLNAVERFARDQGVGRVVRVTVQELERHSGGVQHQGVIAYAPPLELLKLESLTKDQKLLAVALDEIQDPQNFGAVVRSAVGIAGAAIIWGENASAPLSPAMFRASAGAIEQARLCRVPSLRDALRRLADAGAQVIGLDARAPLALHEMSLGGPLVLVIGGEHEGLGRSIRPACQVFARLLSAGTLDSLNASVAAGIALHTVLVSRINTVS